MTLRPKHFRNFQEFRDEVVDKFLAFHPSFGSTLGLHEYDDLLENFSTQSRETYLLYLKNAKETLDKHFHEISFDRLENFERRALDWKINEEIFRLEEFREFEWNPIFYDTQLELQHLFHRDYAPLEIRVGAALKRLRAIPRALAVARQNLRPDLDRTILETAIMVFEGRLTYLESIPSRYLGPLSNPRLSNEIGEALMEAKLSLASFIESLRTVVLPNSKYDSFRLGGWLMQEFLSKTELVHDNLESLLQRGKADIDRLTARLMEVSRTLDPALSPHEAFRMYVEHDHFSEESIFQKTESMLESIRQFLIDRHIISVPSDVRCAVRPMPEHMRWAFAAMDSPGAFERVATEAYYYVTPPEASWDEAKRKDFLRGLNRAVLEIISIHEAYPGHYIHFLHLQQAKSKLGRIFWSYAFIEGWAHYTEEMMMEEGWGKGDARVEMAYLQEALIRLCRYVSAIELHRGTMTLSESQHLFEEKALMHPVSAKKEAERGVFDPGYLFYTLGKFKIQEIRTKRKQHSSFTLQGFHDELLSYGTAPVALIADVMQSER
jgi:hypothetical protein